MARTIAKVKEIEPTYLTIEGLERYLGFANVDTQRKWRERGDEIGCRLPFFKFGRQIVYKIHDVDRFIERHRITPASVVNGYGTRHSQQTNQ